MPASEMRLIKRAIEFVSKENVSNLPKRLRGIYVLYCLNPSDHDCYDVKYVGMAKAGRGRGLRGRLSSHSKSRSKGKKWTHFSAFEVWENIRDDEVAELEGIFRHIYRRDSTASTLNIQKGFNKLRKLKRIELNNK